MGKNGFKSIKSHDLSFTEKIGIETKIFVKNNVISKKKLSEKGKNIRKKTYEKKTKDNDLKSFEQI